jgi:hypothetical protein
MSIQKMTVFSVIVIVIPWWGDWGRQNLLGDVLTGAEREDSLCRNMDFLVRLGIAGFARGSLLHLEDSEIPQLDPSVLLDHLQDSIHASLYDLLGQNLVDLQFRRNFSDHFFFGQGKISLEKTS